MFYFVFHFTLSNKIIKHHVFLSLSLKPQDEHNKMIAMDLRVILIQNKYMREYLHELKSA